MGSPSPISKFVSYYLGCMVISYTFSTALFANWFNHSAPSARLDFRSYIFACLTCIGSLFIFSMYSYERFQSPLDTPVSNLLTQFDSVADVTYPGAYGRFLDSLGSTINIDLGMVLSAGCAVKTDFHDRLLISTLGPLAALGGLGVCFRVAVRRYRWAPEALEGIRRKHISLALLVTFLVYSSVSSTIFRMFACEELDDGEEYLRADYSILCTSSKHRALQVRLRYMW